MNDRDTLNSMPSLILFAILGTTLGFVGSVFTIRYFNTWPFYVALAMLTSVVLLLIWNVCSSRK